MCNCSLLTQMALAFSICLRAFTQESVLLVQTSLTSPLRRSQCQLLHYYHSLERQHKCVVLHNVENLEIFMFYLEWLQGPLWVKSFLHYCCMFMKYFITIIIIKRKLWFIKTIGFISSNNTVLYKEMSLIMPYWTGKPWVTHSYS